MHGLLSPYVWIDPYDHSLYSLGSCARAAWRQKVFEQMGAAGLLDGRKTLVWLCGDLYNRELWSKCKTLEVPQETPLQGLGIGKRIKWLQTHKENL